MGEQKGTQVPTYGMLRIDHMVEIDEGEWNSKIGSLNDFSLQQWCRCTCNRCVSCRYGMYLHHNQGGWELGEDTIGTQATMGG